MAGEILKKRREESGIAIQEAAAALKIRKDYLSAIEEDAFGKLPVPVYTVGYIRAYAKYLGVDSEPIVEFYNKHLVQPESAAIMPVAFSRKKGPGIYAGVALVAVVAAVAALFLFFGQRTDQTVPPASKPPVKKQEVPAVVSPEAAPQPPPVETKGHSLKIVARETTWLSIRFSDGKKDEALLHPGDSRDWTFPDRATLRIGNAGGIDIQLDGRNLGTPGDPSEVMTLTLPEAADTGLTSP